MRQFRWITLLLAGVLSAITCVQAQIVIPAPSNPDKPPMYRIFGLSGTIINENTKVSDLSPMLDIYVDHDLVNDKWPNLDALFFLKLKAGAGLTPQNVDSVKIGSILYPESGDIGFGLGTYPHYKTKSSKKGWSNYGLYGDLIMQKRLATSEEKTYSFNAITWKFGPKLTWDYRNGSNPFELYVGGFRKSIEISNTIHDFRTVFDNNLLPSLYRGWSINAGMQLNTFNIEGEMNIFKNLGNIELRDFSGITYNVRLTIVGDVYIKENDDKKRRKSVKGMSFPLEDQE